MSCPPHKHLLHGCQVRQCKGILLNKGLLMLLLTVYWDFQKTGCSDEPASFGLSPETCWYNHFSYESGAPSGRHKPLSCPRSAPPLPPPSLPPSSQESEEEEEATAAAPAGCLGGDPPDQQPRGRDGTPMTKPCDLGSTSPLTG